MTELAVGSRRASEQRVTALHPVTKFQAPRVRAEHVERSRCLLLTDDELAPHVLVSAPGGAGKSTLAAQWAARRSRCGWVSLSAEDDDPGQFWAAFLGGLGIVLPGFGAGILAELLGGVELRRVLVELTAELAAADAKIALVLDDLHLIADPECHRWLAWLLQRSPSNFRMLICTRIDPPWPIDRLVVRARLTLLRGHDLEFTAQETREFLHDRLGLDLDARELEAIAERTDGWAAGIYLAALSLRAGAPPGEVIDGLAPGDHRVQEYVESEVLHELDHDRLRFLGTIAALERFSAELCDAVLDRTDSGAVLEELERSNLFVIPLDRTGTWFRLHHFFAALLRARHRPPDLETVYARAAAWHRRRDDIPEAIRYLVAAGRPEEAAELMAASYPLYVNRSRLGGTLRRWLAMLPPQLVASSPPLCLMSAWAAGFGGGGPELERWLNQAERLPHEGPLPDGSASAAAQAAVIRSVFCAGDLAAGRRFARQATSLDLPDSPWWPVSRALEGIWGFLIDGPTDEVLGILEEAAPLAAAAGQDIVAATAYGDAAVLLLERGSARAAQVAADRCAELRERSGIGRMPQAAATWWTSSRVHLAVGRTEEARHEAESGVALVRRIPPEDDSILLAPPCFIQLARVRLAERDLDRARTALSEARRRLSLASQPGVIAGWLDEVETLVRDLSLDQAHADHLTERELAVLRLLAGPATLRDIAAEMALSHNTIKSHAKAIYAKLDVPGRAEAVRRAQQLGLIA